MKAVITVVGEDRVGIIALTSAECAKHGVNILDISQTVMQNYFCMIMLVEISTLGTSFKEFSGALAEAGAAVGVDIRVMHEDIFNSMHKI